MPDAHSELIVSKLAGNVYFKFRNRLQELCWNIASAVSIIQITWKTVHENSLKNRFWTQRFVNSKIFIAHQCIFKTWIKALFKSSDKTPVAKNILYSDTRASMFSSKRRK